jgi:hypothetical protein
MPNEFGGVASVAKTGMAHPIHATCKNSIQRNLMGVERESELTKLYIRMCKLRTREEGTARGTTILITTEAAESR